MTGGCLPCEMERAAPDAVVFRDDLWAAEVAPGYEVPGWFFLRVRRHAELLTGLNDAELSALGHRARDLVAAVTEATGAPSSASSRPVSSSACLRTRRKYQPGTS